MYSLNKNFVWIFYTCLNWLEFAGKAQSLRVLWLISLQKPYVGVVVLSVKETVEERKAQILMRLRGYKLVKKIKQRDAMSFLVKTNGEKKTLLWCLPTQGTVGVQFINQVKKAMNDLKVERGIIVTSGRYTQAAKTNARKRGIELIPRIFPSFNIYEHVLVPKHEIATSEEREKVLSEFRVQPYQLPRLKASDPAVKAIGAKPGDIVKIMRDSPTAGKYVSYRYVIEG
jgi:DNA-directed RNA polymerase subunit H (RpoH/RPB5)